jgi:hypothetical protein
VAEATGDFVVILSAAKDLTHANVSRPKTINANVAHATRSERL